MWTCQFCLPFFFYTSFHPFLLPSFSLTSYAPCRLLPPSLSLYLIFFPSDPLFLTFTVFFSPFLIPLFIFLDIFPLPISLSSLLPSHLPCILSFHPLHPSSPLSLMRACSAVIIRAEVGDASHARLLHRLSSDLRGNVSPATTMRVCYRDTFQHDGFDRSLSLPGDVKLTSLGPSAADKHRLNIWEFQTSSTLPHRRRSALFRLPPGAVLVGFVLFVDGFLYNQSSLLFVHNEWSWIIFPR